MGKGGQTIGYHYLCSLLFGIGRGPVNELTKIKVGGKLAWEGNLTDDSPTAINKPSLFGGEKKEGGIQGLFRNLMGEDDQIIPGAVSATIAVGGVGGLFGAIAGTLGPYTKATLPALRVALSPDDPDNVPEFRGRHVFWYDGLVSSMNPYIKEWEFRRWRTTAGWFGGVPWYEEKATIYLTGEAGEPIYAMNPAHIVYQASTDPVLGRGIDPDELDEDSFILAANTFCTEAFGLCFNWQREDEIGNFIQSVCDHAGMVVYTDRETGLINIKAIRNDYDPDDLPHFTVTTGLLSITEDDSGSSDEISDEIIVNGKSPVSNQQIQGRAHNLAVRLFRRGSSPKTTSYPGLPTVALCNRVAERDRDMGASGLRKFTVKLDRAGFRLHPGSVFKVTYAPRGLSGIILRVGEVDDGNLLNGEITVSCVQDVFSTPLESFVTPVENTWEAPPQEAVPAPAELLEASYRDLYLRLSTADLEAIAAEASFPATAAAKPSVSSTSYILLDRADGETAWPATAATNFFTGSAVLTTALLETDTEFTVDSETEFPDDEEELIGKAVYVSGEYMRIEAYDPDTHIFTVARGCVDTWPQAHDIGERMWLIDDDLGFNSRTYVEGESVEAVVITRTDSDVLSPDEAPMLETVMEGRPFRPYPPADVNVNGASIYGGDVYVDEEEPVISWAERNRKTQADFLIGYFETGVTDEDGTTYKVKIYDEDQVFVAEHDAIAGSPWTYDAALQLADSVGAGTLLFARIYAVRDGVESLEQKLFPIRQGSVLVSDGEVIYEDGEFITA